MRRPNLSFKLKTALALVATLGVGIVGFVPTVYAIPVEITINLPQTVTEVRETIRIQLLRAGIMALTQAAETFAGQIAYDAANYIASGGNGQGALFFNKSPGDYLANVASDAGGAFMASLSNDSFFRGLGVDLCHPRSPDLTLRLQLSLPLNFPELRPPNGPLRPQPACNFSQVIDSYSNLFQTLSSQDVLHNVRADFNPNSSDIGLMTSVLGGYSKTVNTKVANEALARAEGQGFKALTDRISGRIKTPSQLIQQGSKSYLVEHPRQSVGGKASGILSNAASIGFVQLGIYTLSMFVNTLASKSLQRLFETGLDSGSSVLANLNPNANPDDILALGKFDARKANIDLRNPPPQQTAEFDTVVELTACPPANRGLWNCTIDQPFFQALSSRGDQGAMTIKQALDRGLLHGDWKLVPSNGQNDKENQDPSCYTYAYCAGNLQKLRLLRILPVGFEFAANSMENIVRCKTAQGCITLKEVVDRFTQCGDQGLDAQNPWCHLIDPNWVLTVLPQQCAMSGFSETLASAKIGLRKEECQDVQSCLKRNNKGECVGGYGYCLADKTVYRFQAQECTAEYASCRTYANRAGQDVSLLRNTLDYSQCRAQNVGCLWYATEQDPAAPAGQTNWLAGIDSGQKTYFTNKLAVCPAAQAGCTKMLAVRPGESALNLLLNPSFETATGSDATPLADKWLYPDTTPIAPVIRLSDAFYGSKTLEFNDAAHNQLSQLVQMAPSRNYTVSVYVRSLHPAAGDAFTAQVRQFSDAAGRTALPIASGSRLYRSSGCRLSGADVDIHLGGTDEAVPGAWQRYECTFLTDPAVASASVTLTGSVGVLVDGVQLEEGDFATDFVDGVNPSLTVASLRLPPEELHCAGLPTDSAACADYAKMCRQADAGCQGYTDKAGGSEVPALLTANDTCPTSCVGYSEFRKAPSAFDLIHDADPRFDDPQDATSTYFIPATAQTCKQVDVGCSAFTSIEDGAVTNYTYARLCQKPGADSQTYFTWEGSDTTGFQLHTWSLLRQTADPAHATAVLGPKIVARRGADQIYKDPATCGASYWQQGIDPDCRQFYDASGNVFYAYYSQTVLSTSQCVSQRISQSNRADCEKTGGTFNSSGCIYQTYAPESRTCPAAAVGCRAYLGSGAGNIQLVLKENFRGTANVFSSGRISSEALLVGDSSLRLEPTAAAGIETHTLIPSSDRNLYRVSFWAKAPGSPSTAFTVQRANQDHVDQAETVGAVTLGSDWQQFTVGPFNGMPGTDHTQIRFTSAGPLVFLDEVAVEQIQDYAYVIANSWQTPNVCDQSPTGAAQPQAMLGCRAYQDRKQRTVYARQFSRLCRDTAIGCTAFVDTRNSNDIGSKSFTLSDHPPVAGYAPSTTVIRPAHRVVYAVDDQAGYCQADNYSCRAFGKPNFTPDRHGLVAGHPFDTVYFKDDINQYGAALCKPSEIFCDEFNYGAGKDYFRDPQNHICEYRAQVHNVSGFDGQNYSGWFQPGTNVPCYPGIIASGNTFNLAKVGDPGYAGWGGICPPEQNACTEFRDPNDTSDPLHRSGKPYYFLRNEKLDTTTCAGNVDIGQGCILLRDMSDGSLNYNVAASYAKYRNNNFDPTPPLNCQTNSADPACAVKKYCQGNEIFLGPSALVGIGGGVTTDLVEVGRAPWVGSECTQDSQCHPRDSIDRSRLSGTRYEGRCQPMSFNDTNLLVKVNIDRDCSQWLGCKSAETVYDPTASRYRSVCTDLAMCDKATEQAGDTFCADYVKRDTTSTEPVLAKGAFFNAAAYARRDVGLGQKDYSGYAIPNAFQTVDLRSAKVAAEGADRVDPQNKYRFAQDYRLVAAVPMPPIVNCDSVPAAERVWYTGCSVSAHPREYMQDRRLLTANMAQILNPSDSDLARSHPELSLCQHIGTGRIGYYRPSESGSGLSGFCYLAVRSDSDRFDFQTVLQKFAVDDPGANATLSQAFPPPECRIYPEQDSPFPTAIVSEWDTAKNPPIPKTKAAGFSGAASCEFGETCSCTYKRVEYRDADITKYYNVNSQAVPPGVCAGGPRNGQSCIPDTIFKLPGSIQQTVLDASAPAPTDGSAQKTKTIVRATEGSNLAETCGPPEAGGRCIAYSKLEIVRGIFGQCLERDTTRTIAGRGTSQPCLSWNPNPILYGEKDTYHYAPTAGYQPPENAGQYYCTSYARKPLTVRLTEADFAGMPQEAFAGGMTNMAYDDHYVADKIAGGPIDGGTAEGTTSLDQCEAAEGVQDDNNGQSQPDGLRLIGTGRTLATGYAETFFKVNGKVFTSRFFSSPHVTTEQVNNALSDSNIGYMSIAPIRNPNGKGRLACGYNAFWVDNLSVDYNDSDSLVNGDQQWHQLFSANYNPVLTRGSETVMTRPDSDATLGAAYVMPCVNVDDGLTDAQRATQSPGSWQNCYFKTWETSYRADNGQKFKAVVDLDRHEPARSFEDIRHSPFYETCQADKLWFAVRAVFQADARQSVQGTGPINRTNVKGPWRFVGFWVSSCAAKTNDLAYMYMNIDVTSADVCRQLAEVRSKDSRQDAAFTDRIWKSSGYIAPGVSIQYGSSFAPFSSALNVRPAGHQPLFQTGQMAAGFSPLNPPDFLSSGADTYYRLTPSPKDKWAYLTNLFARIYRIYNYHEQPVTRTDKACLSGPFKGTRCDPTAPAAGATADATASQSPQCSLNGVCDSSGLAPNELDNLKLCDAFSGINSGLPCGQDPDMCHTGAVVISPTTGQPSQRLLPCQVDASNDGAIHHAAWTQDAATGLWAHWIDATHEETNHDQPIRRTTLQAANEGAFVCATVGDRVPVNHPLEYSAVSGGHRLSSTPHCSAPSNGQPVRECPELVYGHCDLTRNKCQIPVGGSSVAQARAFPVGSHIPTPDHGYVDATDDYPSCTGDFDCSFTDMNFYLDRGSGRTPLFSARSLLMVPPLDGACTPPHPALNGKCLYETKVNLANHVDSRVSGAGSATDLPTASPDANGLACTLQALRAGNGTGDQRTPPFDGQHSTCIGHDNNSVSTERLSVSVGDQHREASEFTRFPGLVNGDVMDALKNNAPPPVPGNQSFLDVLESGASDIVHSVVSFLGGPPADNWQTLGLAACVPASALRNHQDFGRCKGGVFAGKICLPNSPRGSAYSCLLADNPANSEREAGANRCGPVEVMDDSGQPHPVPECRDSKEETVAIRGVRGYGQVTTSNDPDKDNNICTHGQGYYPRLDLCPDPSDEFCGLIAYDITDTAAGGSLDPSSAYVLPTDVTIGHHTPFHYHLTAPREGGVTAMSLNYLSYYGPMPPRVAAPDIQNCASSGQCPIQRLDNFSLDGQSEGLLNVVGGIHKAAIRFYAWAAHNQMPLRQLTIDWGDHSNNESLTDARLKNHKPFCSVQKECDSVPGLTCNTDSDCPAGAGRCVATGLCVKQQNISCHQNEDCGQGDTCNIRTMFGNSADACETNYMEYEHVYACPGQGSLPSCLTTPAGSDFRCSRDPARTCDPAASAGAATACAAGDACISGLAPPGGCWDAAANACRFTPRLMLQDNWGWCTGECRAIDAAGVMSDSASSPVKHENGGCYAGGTTGAEHPNVKSNKDTSSVILGRLSECYVNNPLSGFGSLRPWIVYPGALNLRSSGELITAPSP